MWTSERWMKAITGFWSSKLGTTLCTTSCKVLCMYASYAIPNARPWDRVPVLVSS